MIVRIATRRSPLALWQANHVAELLRSNDPSIETELVSMDTFADQRLDLPISDLGGKGAFSKEVQDLVLAERADIAVHSAKDLQALTPEGLTIGAFPERGDPRDALVGCRLDDLPVGGSVATGSNRRRVQLAALRPDLTFVGLRGNIATRLSHLDDVDAIVMANVPVARLGLTLDVVDVLAADVMVPQVGQGALAVEARADDHRTLELLAAIDHGPSRMVVEAERGFLVELGGDCDLPAGAFAWTAPDGAIALRAVLASEDETRLVRVELDGDGAQPSRVGAQAANELRSRLAS